MAEPSSLDVFFTVVPERPDVLELGTCRSVPDRPTHHRAWFREPASFVGMDIADGVDVDVVGDAHAMPLPDVSVDVILACSVFEHLARPWIVVGEMWRVLRPGGTVYVQTHQTFPVHGFPEDFWRFTTAGMRVLFDGWEILSCAYQFPARVVPAVRPPHWNSRHEAWLNVDLCARKPVSVEC